MEEDHKKTALRAIPYGLYVLGAETSSGVTASTINWVTQTSFDPPLVAVGIKADSAGYAIVKDSKHFALSVLGKGQQEAAFAFFKPVERDGDNIGGQPFRVGSTGSPILATSLAHVECKVVETVEVGDHHIVVGQVVDAGVSGAMDGRPDDATLKLGDLGDKIFYGG